MNKPLPWLGNIQLLANVAAAMSNAKTTLKTLAFNRKEHND